ncbi:allatotropin precursor protein [Hyalella azteca]|uniref:Allatotropin protein n=1 Tax=Hyalella azteca TaxID=294128 RepID=A0A6A0HC08_HYAAZ|nr:allatotropin precursor protein [Hyalella azteca]
MWWRVWLTLLLVLTVAVLSGHSLELGLRRAALMARARQEAADRLRRGFQNSALATARGFGKRSHSDLHYDSHGQSCG